MSPVRFHTKNCTSAKFGPAIGPGLMGSFFLLALLPLLSVGCASRSSHSNLNVSSRACISQPCPTLAKASLTQVPLESRAALLWPELPELTGKPLEIAEASSVRVLSWQELCLLATRGDTNSRLLSSAPQSGATATTPTCLQAALACQAKHLASQAVARAGEAYLGLHACYLQNELLQRAREGSERRERMLAKIRQHDLKLELDPRELDRQRLELDKQFAQLAREYQAATVGLELLLELENSPTTPLWPSDSSVPCELPEELPGCLELARKQRPDRQALLALQSCLQSTPAEQLIGLANGLTPWSALTIPPLPARWLNCHRADWEAAARSQLQHQLCALLAENEKQLVLEVNLAFARRWNSREQQRIAEELEASLRQSLDDIEALRAVEPVNIERFLELEQRLASAQSQRVSAAIEQAKAKLDLARAIGLLECPPSATQL